MKRTINMSGFSIPVFAALVMISFAFSSCKKDFVENTDPSVPVSGLMAFNMAADRPAVGFDLGGNRLSNTALPYTGYTGTYLSVYTGSREVRAFDYNSGSTLAITINIFKDSLYYSAFLLGAYGNYRTVVTEDKLLPLTAATGKAWVRYINAIPDSINVPTVGIAAGGDNTISEPAAFAKLSDFTQVNAGNIEVSVSNGSTINANRTVTLDENKIYTLLLTGLPAAVDTIIDPSQAVQITFIQNGYVAP